MIAVHVINIFRPNEGVAEGSIELREIRWDGRWWDENNWSHHLSHNLPSLSSHFLWYSGVTQIYDLQAVKSENENNDENDDQISVYISQLDSGTVAIFKVWEM